MYCALTGSHGIEEHRVHNQGTRGGKPHYPSLGSHPFHPQTLAHTLERAIAQHFFSNEILIKENLIAKIIFLPLLCSGP